jgi:hypothetical protein
MTGEPKASQSPSEASKTHYHASIVEYFICSSLVNRYTNQWRLVGFIVEEANLNKHSNNKYTIIIIFFKYTVPGAPKFAE